MGNLPILFSGALPDRYLLPSVRPFCRVPSETVTNLLEAGNDARLKAACREFETIFIAELMRQVLGPSIRRAFSFQGEEGGPRGGATILAELVVEGFSKEMAASLHVGLAEKVYEAVSGRERVQTADGGSNGEGRAEERR